MRLHGCANVTDALDILFARDPENLEALASALATHPRLRGVAEDLPFRWDARTLILGANFTLATDAGVVDLLSQAPGCLDFERAYQAGDEVQVGDSRAKIAALDDLIAMKCAANRPKDQLHLLELLALRKLRQE